MCSGSRCACSRCDHNRQAAREFAIKTIATEMATCAFLAAKEAVRTTATKDSRTREGVDQHLTLALYMAKSLGDAVATDVGEAPDELGCLPTFEDIAAAEHADLAEHWDKIKYLFEGGENEEWFSRNVPTATGAASGCGWQQLPPEINKRIADAAKEVFAGTYDASGKRRKNHFTTDAVAASDQAKMQQKAGVVAGHV